MQLLVKRNGRWERPKPSLHAQEVGFQQLVQDVFPQVLASQFDRPSVVAREVQAPHGGRIDVVSIDQDGIITLCECKLEKNAGSRREVLGQVLEYAGAFAGMPVDDFAGRVASRLDTDLLTAMAQSAAEDFHADAWRAALDGHLRAGRFRLVVAVDALTDTLRQTVLYLNDHADFSLVVAELRLVTEGSVEMLVPRLFGEEAAERKLVSRTKAAPGVRNPDVVIVPATKALAEFQRLGAYICQPRRSFQPVKYLGFYWQRRIEPQFPKVWDFVKDVLFTPQEAERLRADPDALTSRVGEVVQQALGDPDSDREVGERYQVVPLDLEAGFTLDAPIQHDGPAAWTQNQRYATRDALEKNPATTDELAEAEG
jgi:hypothetical protein